MNLGNPFFNKVMNQSEFKNFISNIKDRHIPKVQDPNGPINFHSFL